MTSSKNTCDILLAIHKIATTSWTSIGSASEALKHTIFAGYQSDGKKIFIGRTTDENGNFIPSRIIPEDNKAYFEENGTEKSSDKMEYILCNDGYEWLKSSNGQSVADAVILSGNYVGRAEVGGTTVVGKVDLKSKQLVALFDGKSLNLKDYEVLVSRPQLNKTRFQQAIKMSKESSESFYSNIRSDASISSSRTYTDSSFNQGNKFLEMQLKIETLEHELANARIEIRDYEQRLINEERKNQDVQKQMQFLRHERSSYTEERSNFEDRLSIETSRVAKLELQIKQYENENDLLLKKVANLEDALRAEKYQLESYTEKFRTSQASSAESSKVKTLEDKIKNQQQRIFELEMLLETSRSDSDAFKSRITSFESTIEHQKIQFDGMLKKLQGSNANKEYLVQKVGILTQNLKQYQFEIESMTVQLQNAKSMIASLTAELGRVNGQLSKFQSALSNSYLLNGELMTKVSSMSSMSQYNSSFESKFDLLNLNLNSIEASSKAYTYSTPSLLEATGSETYMRYIRSSSAMSDGNSDSGNVSFTTYTGKKDESSAEEDGKLNGKIQ